MPPYSYVPGGPFPHPTRDPKGHSYATAHEMDNVNISDSIMRGARLFDAGCYWEAHEAWEDAWHALGRNGPQADALRALIKLAAAGVKVREGQPHGVHTHARRAAELFQAVAQATRETGCLGLDLDKLEARARGLATSPIPNGGPLDAPIVRVFEWSILDLIDPAAESGRRDG